VRFGIVGVINTAAYYLSYRLLLTFLPYLAAHLIAYPAVVTLSYVLNTRYTFGAKGSVRTFALYPLASVANLVFSTMGLSVLVELMDVSRAVASLIAQLAAVPITYLITKRILQPTPYASHSERSKKQEPSP
jgi:putative flippase GtrA